MRVHQPKTKNDLLKTQLDILIMSYIPMNLRIKTLSGEIIEIDADPLETLDSLQKRIIDNEGVKQQEILEIRLNCEIILIPTPPKPNFWNRSWLKFGY